MLREVLVALGYTVGVLSITWAVACFLRTPTRWQWLASMHSWSEALIWLFGYELWVFAYWGAQRFRYGLELYTWAEERAVWTVKELRRGQLERRIELLVAKESRYNRVQRTSSVHEEPHYATLLSDTDRPGVSFADRSTERYPV